jgi:spoIIIJ-associated protein
MAYKFIKEGKLEREALVAELRHFLTLLLDKAHLDVQYEIQQFERGAEDVENPEVLITFRGRDQELFLQQHAELLTAIEYIAHRWLRLDPHFYDHVQFDCGDIRAMRLEELRLSAKVAAQRVVETRQPFKFNPMSARERRVIHLVLKGFPGVRTSSEGVGDHRQVVIHPA